MEERNFCRFSFLTVFLSFFKIMLSGHLLLLFKTYSSMSDWRHTDHLYVPIIHSLHSRTAVVEDMSIPSQIACEIQQHIQLMFYVASQHSFRMVLCRENVCEQWKLYKLCTSKSHEQVQFCSLACHNWGKMFAHVQKMRSSCFLHSAPDSLMGFHCMFLS